MRKERTTFLFPILYRNKINMHIDAKLIKIGNNFIKQEQAKRGIMIHV